jgi:hypothetical protein
VAGSFGNSCNDPQKTWLDASVWIGIDGWSSGSVEQTGTSSDCFYGQVQYYAWYEFYPANSVTINTTAIHAGDVMTAQVSYSTHSGLFTTTITDVSTHQSYTSPATAAPLAQRNSAEWIVESAYASQGILALTPFSQVQFTSTSATIDGATHPLSGWGANVQWALMVDYNWGSSPSTTSLTWAKAEPLALGRGNGFTVNWLSIGP